MSTNDKFSDYPVHLSDPAADFYAITPSDSADESTYFRAIYVGGAGDVVVKPIDDGTAVTFSSVPAGTILPVRGRRVNSTDTTATNMVGLY